MPHRASLLSQLQHYQKRFPHETAPATILAFVQQHPDCFQRELSTGHITGSAWIVDASHTKTLLIHHKKLNKWLQLGGHADGEPDALAVALREAEEESGMRGFKPLGNHIFDVDVHEIPEYAGEPAHRHYDIRYALEAPGPAARGEGSESSDLAWVPLAQVRTYSTDASLLRMVEKTFCAELSLSRRGLDAPEGESIVH